MSTPAPLYPKVDKPFFLGFMWAGVAVSICCIVFRLAIRVRSYKKVYFDDGLVVFALLLFIASSIAWQTQINGLYIQYALTRGEAALTPAVIDEFESSQKVQIGVLFCFYTGLWSIKLSFLLFFRRLFDRVQKIKVWWWVVLGFAVATYFVVIGTIQYRCLVNDIVYIFTECSLPDSLHFQEATFRSNLAMDVISDCAIISIPVVTLWNVQIPWKQKLGLMGVFSVTVFIMVIAIVRVVVVSKESKQADITWLYFWTNLEMTVALIVSCLASFRQLFVKSDRVKHQFERPTLFMSLRQKLLGSTRWSTDHSTEAQTQSNEKTTWSRARRNSVTTLVAGQTSSGKLTQHPKDVQVTREFEVSSDRGESFSNLSNPSLATPPINTATYVAYSAKAQAPKPVYRDDLGGTWDQHNP